MRLRAQDLREARTAHVKDQQGVDGPLNCPAVCEKRHLGISTMPFLDFTFPSLPGKPGPHGSCKSGLGADIAVSYLCKMETFRPGVFKRVG